MAKLIGRIVSEALMRRIRGALATRNQRYVAKLCKRETDILIDPVNNVEHYYHFLFDLALPLFLLWRRAPRSAQFVITDIGPFSARIEQIFPSQVRIEAQAEKCSKIRTAPLWGMNPRWVNVRTSDILSFKEHVCSIFGVRSSSRPNKVLLIERLPPDDYFRNHATKKGAGSSRRSIANFAELASAVESVTNPPLEFRVVQLEKLDFQKQIELFDDAAIVIGQHGAGLANCIWMQPRSIVLELTHDPSLTHFREVCVTMDHTHESINTSGPHAAIDIQKFSLRFQSTQRHVTGLLPVT